MKCFSSPLALGHQLFIFFLLTQRLSYPSFFYHHGIEAQQFPAAFRWEDGKQSWSTKPVSVIHKNMYIMPASVWSWTYFLSFLYFSIIKPYPQSTTAYLSVLTSSSATSIFKLGIISLRIQIMHNKASYFSNHNNSASGSALDRPAKKTKKHGDPIISLYP